MRKPKKEYSKKIVFWTGVLFVSQIIAALFFLGTLKTHQFLHTLFQLQGAALEPLSYSI